MRRLVSSAALVLLSMCSSEDETAGPAGNIVTPPRGDAGVGPSDADGVHPANDGATASDAAQPNGARDALVDDAAPKVGCAGSTHKLCEDFESSTVGMVPTGWTVLDGWSSSPRTTLVASDESHSPPHSIKTSSDIAGASRVQKALSGLGSTAGTHWGRIFYKVQTPPPQLSGYGPHATFVALQGNLRAGELRVVDTQQASSGKIQLLANTPDDQCCTGTDFTYTVWDGAWHCAEWYVDPPTQSYRAFLDGTEIDALKFSYGAGSDKANMPTAFTSVGVGTIFYTPTLPSPLVTWFDDLAIDDTQIGCTY